MSRRGLNNAKDNDVRPQEVECGGGSLVEAYDPEEDAEHWKRDVQRMKDPRLPRRDEVEAHELTHLPFRSWCKHCVRGRGKEMPHHKVTSEVSVNEFHFDWAFPGEEEAGKTLNVLVGRMRETRMTMGTVHPRKTGEFMTKRVMAFLRECGCEMARRDGEDRPGASHDRDH